MDLKAMLTELLPRAVFWAESVSTQAAAGRALSAMELELARSLGVSRPEAVRIAVVGRMPIPEDPLLRTASELTDLLGPGTVGLTLGHTIFLRRGSESRRLLSHELRHVYQYEQAGSIAAFLAVYLEEIVEVGYAASPLERDARAHEVGNGRRS